MPTIDAPATVSDPQRLAVLDGFGILDTGSEQGFDDIVQLATVLCATPIALVSLVAGDRQWFKARVDFPTGETDLSRSVCAHALGEPDLLVIRDLTQDPRTRDNPLVTGDPHIRFYAGAPLRSEEGLVLGTLCVIDREVRPEGLTETQADAMRALARQVMAQFELRRAMAVRDALLAARVKAEERQAALLELGDSLRDAHLPAECVRLSSEILGRTLDLSHAGYGAVDQDGETVEIRDGWNAPALATVAGQYRFRDYGSYVEDLKRGLGVWIADVAEDPRTSNDSQALGALSIQAFGNVPVMERGRFVALMFAHRAVAQDWSPDEQAFLRDVADRTRAAIARAEGEERQAVLNHELSHRLKNTLAMVQAIASQTLRTVEDRQAVTAFNSRLAALSGAHDILLQKNWAAADMRTVVAQTLALHAEAGRIALRGPNLALGPKAVLSLSLLLHELATNAVKYGSLSVDGGSVDLDWSVEEGTLSMMWRERDGPPAAAPTRKGFGSRLIRTGLVGTGDADLRYQQDGLCAEFKAPLPRLTEV